MSWMQWHYYREVCDIKNERFREAIAQSAKNAIHNFTVKQWRKEFFALPEIQQRPAGKKRRVKLNDPQRQRFWDVEGNLWERVGSARGDVRIIIQDKDGGVDGGSPTIH